MRSPLWFCLLTVGCEPEKDRPSAEPDDTAADTATHSPPPPQVLPECSGSVYDRLTKESMGMPSSGSEGYLVADGTRLALLESALHAVFSGEHVSANNAASTAGYQLCAGVGAEAGLVLGEPLDLGTGEARFIWRESPTRGYILGAPHPWFDTGTLEESVALFQQIEARVLIVSGTHRCANENTSGCDGTTSVCGESAPYRESDMAHVAESLFQVIHQVSIDTFESDWVVSVHGMAADGVSLSNGVGGAASVDGPVGRLYAAFSSSYPDEYITTCNEGSGAVVDQRLCGSTNTQGRYVNGSVEVCNGAATEDASRFVHMEQSRDFRDDPSGVGQVLIEAWESSR